MQTYKKKRKQREWLEFKEKKKKEMLAQGATQDTAYLLETAEKARKKTMKKRKKEERQAAFGPSALHTRSSPFFFCAAHPSPSPIGPSFSKCPNRSPSLAP